MGAYAVLIAVAVYLLHGQEVSVPWFPHLNLLYAVLVAFGGLIAKTLIAAAHERQKADSERREDD